MIICIDYDYDYIHYDGLKDNVQDKNLTKLPNLHLAHWPSGHHSVYNQGQIAIIMAENAM